MSGRRKKRVTHALLPFSPVRNSALLSEHWLEHRLKLEPEWTEARQHADEALTNLLDLWQVQRSRVEQYGDEAGLEQAFIQPVLQALGWKIKYQTYLDRREPDYALFENDAKLDAALTAGRKSPDFWKHPTLLADAKAWHINLDRPTRIGSKREYPPEQIEWYLDRSLVDFAILTNGKLWRLIPRVREAGKPRFQTYLEVDLKRVLDEWFPRQRTFDAVEFDDFFRFFLFFRPGTFHPGHERVPLIRRAIQGSSEYCLSVGEDLKERVFEALRLCIEGFLAYSPNALSPDSDLEMCREQSLIFLYRLLFVMYAEDRALLPYRVNRTYTTNRSLARHRDEIAARLDKIGGGYATPYSDTSTGIWNSLTDLFDLIDHGHGRYGVPQYNGGLFDFSRHEFLNIKMLPDSYLVEVIDQLGRAPDQAQSDAGLFRVDYRDLAIQHLGSIYEGLLEVHPRYATMPMVVVRSRARERRTELIQPESQRVPAGFETTETRYEAGSVYPQTDKGERRSFGSYYTPDHIVDCIVRHTLGPICAEIDRRLSKEITETEAKVKRSRGRSRTVWQEKLDALRNDFDDRVLALCVLDPAMGSGHFLVRACQYLAEEIATNPHTGDPAADQIEGDEPTLTYWKRRVVESSIFGVDINRMAVELAKLALWLETVSSDHPLSFLDHHFRPGNSLVGGRVSELGALPDPTPLLRNAFQDQLQQRLPILLQPLSDIRAMPSNDAGQIKEKEKLYRKVFQPISNAFKSVADLWTSSFFAERADQPDPEDYAKALESLQDARKTNKLLQAERYQTALASVRSQEIACFHWELEFPEVFFDKAGRRDEG
ncbi:MAG: DNA methyltransferase, partial [Planctomycetota bacterium]